MGVMGEIRDSVVITKKIKKKAQLLRGSIVKYFF